MVLVPLRLAHLTSFCLDLFAVLVLLAVPVSIFLPAVLEEQSHPILMSALIVLSAPVMTADLVLTETEAFVLALRALILKPVFLVPPEAPVIPARKDNSRVALLVLVPVRPILKVAVLAECALRANALAVLVMVLLPAIHTLVLVVVLVALEPI